VWSTYHVTLKAAEALGHADETTANIRSLVAAEDPNGFVRLILSGGTPP